MDNEELFTTVHTLVSPETQGLECGRAGHGAGHTCLMATDDIGLPALLEEFSGRYGQPRNLAMGGYVDPTVTERTGLPLLAPFGEQLVEMRAWAYDGRWIGCGAVRAGDSVQPVVLVAERGLPRPDQLQEGSCWVDRQEGSSWVDRVVTVTGWSADRVHLVDWAAVESRLGTALPGDYKRLVEQFGYGAFDGYLSLLLPDGPLGSLDIVEFNWSWARWAEEDGHTWWEPYRLYPAPGGLLQWASTEQEVSFYWLTEGSDPDRWPILVTDVGAPDWHRFDGSTAEFVHRLLTDPQHPYSTALYFDAHWFESWLAH